jgi:starch synthase
MKKKTKVLFVSQEISPYLDPTHMSTIGRQLPQGTQERGKEIRVFMPRFGCINERRNQLHEVIRLSGMNLIINDTDHPLIIKVASIQSARMQVYFIDNEEYFQRKTTLADKKGVPHKDNDERSMFFCRGVLETVKKLGWAPDIIHCHGWFTQLIPLYMKTIFKDDPVFANTKIVVSLYDDDFKDSLDKDFPKKLKGGNINPDLVKPYNDPTYVNLNKATINLADGVIFGSENINPELVKFVNKAGKPFLSYQSKEEYQDAFSKFYDEIVEEVTVLAE